jgi:hypothetical protein
MSAIEKISPAGPIPHAAADRSIAARTMGGQSTRYQIKKFRSWLLSPRRQPRGWIVSLAKGRRGGQSFTAALNGINHHRRDHVRKTFSLNAFLDTFDQSFPTSPVFLVNSISSPSSTPWTASPSGDVLDSRPFSRSGAASVSRSEILRWSSAKNRSMRCCARCRGSTKSFSPIAAWCG